MRGNKVAAKCVKSLPDLLYSIYALRKLTTLHISLGNMINDIHEMADAWAAIRDLRINIHKEYYDWGAVLI